MKTVIMILSIGIVCAIWYISVLRKRVTDRSKVDSAVCTIGTSISKKIDDICNTIRTPEAVRDELLALLHTYMEKGDRSILISSHISSDLETLCDDFYMIHDGKVVMHEDVDILLSQYGILKPTVEQYAALDKKYVLKAKKEPYGYRCLTNERQFYMENYPEMVVEKGNIDDMILVMVRGGNVCEDC